MKFCSKCHTKKELNNFVKDITRKDGYHHYCKECKYSLDKNWRKNNREYVISSSKKYYKNNKEKILKYTTDYNIKNKIKRKKYNIDNRERDKKYLEGYHEINKKSIKVKRKKYNSENRDVINKYISNRYKNDVVFRIQNIIRGRIHYFWKNGSKSKAVVKILGCPIIEFKNYLESQFKPEMNWSNHGKIWEIDHVTPVSKFDLTKEENIYKCFHYTNHQPLFKTTEIAKKFGYLNEIGNRNKSSKTL